MPTGELLFDSVVVWNVDEARELFKRGFFGKPLGIPKPRNTNFDAPLVLDLVEAVYLCRKGSLTVVRDGKKLSLEELESHAKKVYESFESRMAVYSDLRERGFIVLPGIKFGSDFAVYRHGPGIDHAPFIIQVKNISEMVSALEIIRSGRLATSVKKHFTISVVGGERVRYIMFEWWRA